MPDYAKELNSAQYQAVTAPEGHTLVVAGAGTGKTRAIVYRLAWLLEKGIAPEEILLLTFTRKAANEMLTRAGLLLNQGVTGLTGGTFHSFAFGALRSFRPVWLKEKPFTLMDSSDISQAVKICRENFKGLKKDASFPKTQTIVSLISKARNKEADISEVIRQDSYHLLPYAEAVEKIAKEYMEYKRERGLLDYDDLLFELETLLKTNEAAAFNLRNRFKHILVDEYQDTNLVQARIVRLLAEPITPGKLGSSVMAVGDEAQSIYAFRGANVRNILDFPKQFPNTRIIRLEENYRSTQPILNIANEILGNAAESFKKRLYTNKIGGALPGLIKPFSDGSEAVLIVQRIQELLDNYKPHEIAVLFRAGFHSYPLENELRKSGISFRKYGGLRFTEAAHIKDLLSFVRLSINPLDFPAFSRIAIMHKGIGPKTMANLHRMLAQGDVNAREKAFKRFPEFQADLEFIRELSMRMPPPELFIRELTEYYRPRLEKLYPEDWPSRLQGIEEIIFMSAQYKDIELFIADMALESPEPEDIQDAENSITLSTVHSAKGLEWNAVIILDAVEDRFPSRHAASRPEDFEEERRLFYVACTRPRQILDIYAPASIYAQGGSYLVNESPFVKELPKSLFNYVAEGYNTSNIHSELLDQESYTDGLVKDSVYNKTYNNTFSNKSGINISECKSGYCRHRIFGRGKIIEHLDSERVKVDFPGYGLKVILAHYLLPEE